MRKHDVRKWLHAILDLLPLVVIPVFMVYSHRHTIDSYSVVAPKYETVQVQQDVLNGKPFNMSSISIRDGDGVDITDEQFVTVSNNKLLISDDLQGDFSVLFEIDGTFNDYDILLNKFTINCIATGDLEVYLTGDDESMIFSGSLSNLDYEDAIDLSDTYETGYEPSFQYLMFMFFGVDNESLELFNVQVFNLTDIFGTHNEPTIEQFNKYFPQEYYPTDSKASALIQNGTVTYDKTDIGNQMFYSLYNTVEQQFNFTKVFNFGDLYNFLNLNLFGGNAPLSIFIIYNIIVYEFLMDMLFVIYSVFMFIIDFIENLFENVFSRAKRGGR